MHSKLGCCLLCPDEVLHPLNHCVPVLSFEVPMIVVILALPTAHLLGFFWIFHRNVLLASAAELLFQVLSHFLSSALVYF